MKELKKSFSYGQLKEELEQLFADPDWQKKQRKYRWAAKEEPYLLSLDMLRRAGL